MNTYTDRINSAAAERLAAITAHAPKLTHVEKMAVDAVREYLKLKLRGKNLSLAVEIFQGGVTNANDTVFVERAQPREAWLEMFKGSMETLLSDRSYRDSIAGARVVAVFHSINVRA